VSAAKKATATEAKLKAFHEESALGKAYDLRLIRRLWPFVLPHWRWLGVSLAALLAMAALNLVRPLLMGDVVKQASSGDAALVMRAGGVLAASIVVQQFIGFAQMYALQIAGARSMADLRARVFSFLQRLRLSYFDRTPVGRLVTRATNDVDAVNEVFASGVLNAAGDLVQLVGIVALMVALDWRLALIAFASMPVVGLLVHWVRRRSREAFRDIRTKTARLNSFLNEQVSGIAVVQAYAREAQMAEEFDEINRQYRDANKASIYYEAILDAAIEMVSTLCIASVLWWVGFRGVGAHPVTFPLVVTFSQYIKQFFEPVSLLAQRYTILQGAMAGAERIFQLLDEPEIETEPAGRDDAAARRSADPTRPTVAFEGVGFSYKPGVPVLRDVSFQVKKGEKVALVGATGAGKSTVLSLLLRLYEHDQGTISLMGRDVRDIGRTALRETFAVVPQDVFLFTGTVLGNLAMADETPDRARAERALDRIGARELFEKRPGGLDAPVDERGANFSAGERQLLAFARALYRDAPIVILDEATASIDSATEARLGVALEAVMENRTSIIIAHRLSTIRAADRIVVFHKGRVVETGTHDELLDRDGVYARLHRLQFSGVPPSVASVPSVRDG
jgi:ATP-binding cassette subfamily B protein